MNLADQSETVVTRGQLLLESLHAWSVSAAAFPVQNPIELIYQQRWLFRIALQT